MITTEAEHVSALDETHRALNGKKFQFISRFNGGEEQKIQRNVNEN